jgi:hypothetical protein
MTEAQFQAQIIQLAKLYGWKIYHTHDSRKSEAGYPDLTMVKGRRLIFAELKVEAELTAEQYFWLEDLIKTGNEVYLWSPDMWDEIQRVITE